MKVLWHTHLKELWVELTVLRLLNVTTSVSASFEVHDEGTAAQQLVQKAVGQGVLVHPGRRRELHQYRSLSRCEPTQLQEAVQGVVAVASEWDVKLRLVDVVGSCYQHL